MILHLTRKEKFTKSFIDFIKNNFDVNEHFFLLVGGQNKKEFEFEGSAYIKILDNKKEFLEYVIEFNKKMYDSEKIIIHGLSQPYNIVYLFFNPWLLKKTYWVMWGADLYGYLTPNKSWKQQIVEFCKKSIIKNMGHFITNIKGDYELAQKWYGAKGVLHESFFHPNNIYKELELKKTLKQDGTIHIQVGNSADPTNNHIEVLQNLVSYKDENIKIFTPLSYGDEAYAKEVIAKGKELFGEKFIPLTEFMPFEKYLEFLSEIDIAIFAHKRQQAMGNTITLLGLGKKVYVDSRTVQFDFFKKHDVEIFDVNNIDLQKLNQTIASENKEKIKCLFSKDVLIQGLQRIFND